jgi:transposase
MAQDNIISGYERLRMVWYNGIGINKACAHFKVPRSKFYDWEAEFIEKGMLGFFPNISKASQ